MTDIVEQLGEYSDCPAYGHGKHLAVEAATEIERLRAALGFFLARRDNHNWKFRRSEAEQKALELCNPSLECDDD